MATKLASDGLFSAGSLGRPLRIMIVDDNHINLSVLSTLIKRRFSHIVEGAPVTVDSGLKAIQLLRTHIFDCILMDIQMPFLSGLDASRRIRNAEDGILAENRNAHIVAVTTAVGDAPELAYRNAEMDGMIGKPVRIKQLQQYLCPLSHEAHLASQTVAPVHIGEEMVMPPLPPAARSSRVFYLPSEATAPVSRPDICEGSDFEKLLNAQTRKSLRRSGIKAHTGDDQPSYSAIDRPTKPATRSASMANLPKQQSLGEPVSTAQPPTSHSRNASMTISRRMLSKQIAREKANADLDGEASDSANQSDGTPRQSTDAKSPRAVLRNMHRPQPPHRASSPSWLCDEAMVKNDTVVPPTRPRLSAITSNAQRLSSDESSGSSDRYSLFSTSLRRESQVSSASGGSDASSTVTTPACDSPTTFWSLDPDKAFEFDKGIRHQRMHSSSTINPSSSEGDFGSHTTKQEWNPSSETMASTFSPFAIPPFASNGEHGDGCDWQDSLCDGHKLSSPLKQQTVGKRGLDPREALELASSVRQLNLTG